MKKLIASVLVSAAVATAASAGTPVESTGDDVVEDVYDVVPVAASSSGMGATGAVAAIAGVILVGAALASSSGTD
ncbi:MAG: hypothetical protein ACRBB0_18925 [Pelagimonas sp.]|uniref:hypothetical protein n=1 Tax=Pelagimonas sp. TaxID=2073170 RepID=UPI003D6AEB3D